VICNEEDTDGRARVTTDEERVLPIEWLLKYHRTLTVSLVREVLQYLVKILSKSSELYFWPILPPGSEEPEVHFRAIIFTKIQN